MGASVEQKPDGSGCRRMFWETTITTCLVVGGSALGGVGAHFINISPVAGVMIGGVSGVILDTVREQIKNPSKGINNE